MMINERFILEKSQIIFYMENKKIFLEYHI